MVIIAIVAMSGCDTCGGEAVQVSWWLFECVVDVFKGVNVGYNRLGVLFMTFTHMTFLVFTKRGIALCYTWVNFRNQIVLALRI